MRSNLLSTLYWSLMLVVTAAAVQVYGQTEVPAWWYQRGVLSTNPANDYAALNVGQLKNLAYAAWQEMNASLTNGAGFAPTFTNADNNYAAVTVGQLKEVARPFYTRLDLDGYAPLVSSTTNHDFALANIGQAKQLFRFVPSLDADGDSISNQIEVVYGTDPFGADTDGDGLSDLYEIKHGLDPVVANDDADDDGLSNVLELQNHTDPLCSDSDHDGISDGWEVKYGLNPLSGLQSSLLGWWQFREGNGTNSVDLSCNSNVAYIVRSDEHVCWRTNDVPIGQALHYNRDYDGLTESDSGQGYVCVPGVKNVRLANGFTVAAWVRLDRSDFSWYANILGKRNGDYEGFLLNVGAERDWATQKYSNTLRMQFDSDYMQSSVNFNIQSWAHVCGVYCATNKSMSLYVNGELCGEKNVPLFVDSSTPLWIGTLRNTYYSMPWDGDIADVRFYTNSLAQADIIGLVEFYRDPDGDGLSNLQEFQHGTNPHERDSDKDGLLDGDEINVYHTKPMLPDSDKDGVNDGEEVEFYTDPNNPNDFARLNADSDHDGLTDMDESIRGTDPHLDDTDKDGMKDGLEVFYGSRVLCWGYTNTGQTNISAKLPGFLKIAAGRSHSVALQVDGTVFCWGSNNFHSCESPSELTGVVNVAAGGYHNIALKGNGTVSCWGWDNFGQCCPPLGLTGVVAVAAGAYHCIALKNDGTVVCWGSIGQDIPCGTSNIVAVAAGDGFCLALRSNGRVFGWGGSTCVEKMPTNLFGVVSIAACDSRCIALKNNGTVVCWDSNGSLAWQEPPVVAGVIAVAVGQGHSMVLKSNGSVMCWGDNARGQSEWTWSYTVTGIVSIAAGGSLSMALVETKQLNPKNNPDEDNDGIPDGWEFYSGLDPLDPNDALPDFDFDGVNNLQEYQIGGSCFSPDADNDGLSDWQEYMLGSKPSLWDSDKDGVSDYDEYINGSDPNNRDSSLCDLIGKIIYSGVQKGIIYVCVTNLTTRINRSIAITSASDFSIQGLVSQARYHIWAFYDVNGNGVNDFWEPIGHVITLLGSMNVINEVRVVMDDPDTDSDGLPDWWEWQNFASLIQIASGDPDGDNVCNKDEYDFGISPTNKVSALKSVSGVVSYNGIQSGPIRISVKKQMDAATATAQTTIPDSGSYLITKVPTPVGYWIEAYCDSNNNGAQDSWEASGYYSVNMVYLDKDLSNINIMLSDPDSDGDSLPDFWEVMLVNFDNSDNVSSILDVQPDDDFDGDGICNRVEYDAGTSPVDKMSALPILQFVESASMVTEEDITVQIPLRLSTPAVTQVVSRITVVQSTAINDEDYQFSASEIMLSPGQTNGVVSVIIKRQGIAESDKTIVFEAKVTSGGAVIGENKRHVLTIVDYSDGTNSVPQQGSIPDRDDALKLRVWTPLNYFQ